MSPTTRIKLVGNVVTINGGTGSIFLVVILTVNEDARNFNNTMHNNYETVQVVDFIDSDIEIDEILNCDIQYSDCLVNYDDMPNLYEE